MYEIRIFEMHVYEQIIHSHMIFPIQSIAPWHAEARIHESRLRDTYNANDKLNFPSFTKGREQRRLLRKSDDEEFAQTKGVVCYKVRRTCGP